MIVARDAHRFGDVLILDRRLEHHAFGELLDHGALDLLPRRLARRIFVAAVLLQRGPSLRELRFGDQDIGGFPFWMYADLGGGAGARNPAAPRPLWRRR